MEELDAVDLPLTRERDGRREEEEIKRERERDVQENN